MATENELAPNPGDEETLTIPGNEPEPEQEIETPETESEDEPKGEAEEIVSEEPEKPEPEKPVEKKKISWELRRINEETNKRREAEKRAAELDAELQRLRGGVKPAPVETEAEPEAVDPERIRAKVRDEIRQEEAINLATERFNAACNDTFEKGKTLYGADFEHAADTMSKALGDEMQKRPEFLQVIVNELDNGPQVYYALSQNLEEAERILKLPTAKMILEIGRMNDKVAKPAAKPISKAPAPVSPVGGTPKNTARLDDDNVPMDQFATLLLTRLAKKA